MTPRTRTLLAALMLAGFALTAPAATAQDDAKKPEGDLAKLQGKWEGELRNDEGKIPIVLEFDGSTVVVTLTSPDGDDLEIEGTVKIDEAKDPKTLDFVDFTSTDGDSIGDVLGLYELDGDTLTYDSGGPNNPRPSKIDPDSTHYLVAQKKAAAKAKAEPAATPDDPEAAKSDLDKLKGKWEGEFHGGEADLPIVMEIDGDDVTITITTPDGDEFTMDGALKLDEAKDPKTLDFVDFTSPSGESAPDSLALYTLDGDTLTIDSGGPGNDRPSKIDPGSDHYLVLKRVKGVKAKQID